MDEITVKAKDVRVGDYLYNNLGDEYNRWTRVVYVETRPDRTYIDCQSWSTRKHPSEVVTVRRKFSEETS